MKGHKAEKGMVPAVTEKRGRIGERCGKDGRRPRRLDLGSDPSHGQFSKDG